MRDRSQRLSPSTNGDTKIDGTSPGLHISHLKIDLVLSAANQQQDQVSQGARLRTLPAAIRATCNLSEKCAGMTTQQAQQAQQGEREQDKKQIAT